MKENKTERSENGKERRSLKERVFSGLDIKPDTLPGESMIEIRGRHSMALHGAGHFELYTPTQIKIRLKRTRITIDGKRLFCIAYNKDTIGIEGLISDISFKSLKEER